MKTAPAKSPWANTATTAPVRRRDSQFEQKKHAVYAAAASLFRARGFDDTSLGELADTLGITKPTIYYYVQNKEDLLFQIKCAAQAEVLNFFKEAERLPASGHEKLRISMIKYAEFMTTDYGICLSIVPLRHMDEANRNAFHEGVREANDILARIMRTGVKDGTLSVSDIPLTIRTIFGSLNWIGFWYEPNGRMRPNELAAKQTDIILNGVRTAAASTAKSKRAPKRASSTRPA